MSLDLSIIIKMVDQITKPVRGMARKIRAAFKGIGGALKKFGASMSKVGQETKNLGLKMVAGAGIIGFAFKRMFVDTAAEFERYQIMLKSLEGSNEKAQQAMDWVSDFATRAPLQLNELMGAYVKLKTFGLDPTNGTLQSLVDMNAKMGGSNQMLEGIILAVGQAWSKGKLQGEEALQLIERGVPVYDLLAKRLKMTSAQVQELQSRGQLGRGAIKLLLEEIGKSAKGAAAEQAKTWSGMVSMISDQWARFANMVMSNGVFDWLKDRLSGFLQKLNDMAASGQLERIARIVGQNIVQAFETFVRVLRQDVWPIMKFIGSGLQWLHDLFGSWKPLIVGIAAVMAGPLLLSMALATKAVIGLGIALMATPVGWIMAAIAAIAGAVYLIYTNWDGIVAYFKGLWKEITDAFDKGFVQGILKLMEFTPLGMIIKNWMPLTTFFTNLWNDITASFKVGFVEGLKKLMEFTPLGLIFKGIDKLRDLLFSGNTGTNTTAPTVTTLSQGTARSEVGGLIKVQVEGAARVTEMETTGGIDMEAESGMAFAG